MFEPGFLVAVFALVCGIAIYEAAFEVARTLLNARGRHREILAQIAACTSSQRNDASGVTIKIFQDVIGDAILSMRIAILRDRWAADFAQYKLRLFISR